jgi:hypothetical protein
LEKGIKNMKLAIILTVSLILHVFIFISMAQKEEVEVQQNTASVNNAISTPEKIKKEEPRESSVGWNSNSVKVSGGIFEGSTVSLTELEPVIAENEYIIYWKTEALILVVVSALFHSLAYVTLRAPTSR